MQYGPGAENAYAGVATAFSDAVPMLPPSSSDIRAAGTVCIPTSARFAATSRSPRTSSVFMLLTWLPTRCGALSRC